MTGFATQFNDSLFIFVFAHILLEELNIVDGLSTPRGDVGFPKGLGNSLKNQIGFPYDYT